MYDLPENPTMADVIKRSVTCHPSLFSESLFQIARIHGNYARQTHNKMAGESAFRMCEAASFAASRVLDNDVKAICENFSAKIIAFGAASKLQCLPRHMPTEIADLGSHLMSVKC